MSLNTQDKICWNQQLDSELTKQYELGVQVKDIANKIGVPEGAASARLSVIGIAGKRRQKSAEFKFGGYTKELAYLIGAFLTDGWSTNGQIGICVNDRDFAENFAMCIEHAIGRSSEIRKRKSAKSKDGFMWKLTAQSWELENWLKTETRNKSVVPDGIMSANEDIILSFLAGAMDGDGIMAHYERKDTGNQRFNVGFCGARYNVVDQVSWLMKGIGAIPIKCVFNNKGARRPTKVQRFNNLSIAHSKFNFGIKRKQNRLELLRQMYLPQRLDVGADSIGKV